MRNLMTLCLACFALVGCSGGADLPRVAADGTPLAEGFDPPPQPDNALQLISPILKDFPPGGNTEFCYYTKTILKSEIIIKAGQGYQTPGGHHVVVQDCHAVDVPKFGTGDERHSQHGWPDVECDEPPGEERETRDRCDVENVGEAPVPLGYGEGRAVGPETFTQNTFGYPRVVIACRSECAWVEPDPPQRNRDGYQ